MSYYNCQFCDKIFTSQTLLKQHQTITKYCLKLQNKENATFKCSYCENNFATKKTLNNHIATTCKVVKRKLSEEKDREIELLKTYLLEKNNEIELSKTYLLEKDNEIKILKNKLLENNNVLEIYKDSQECLKEIAKQPKIQNNNSKNIQNNNNSINIKYANLSPFNLTQEEIRQKIEEKFTEKHLIEGQKGVAIFTHDNLLLDENSNLKYLCGDASRLLFYYKNEDGSIQKDPKGTNLTQMIAEDVIAKSHKMVMGISDDVTVELHGLILKWDTDKSTCN